MPSFNTQQSDSSSQQEQKLNLSPKKWLTARVWRTINSSGEFTEPKEVATKGGQFGHVSTETNKNYASFWPTKPFNPNLITPVPATHALSPAHDISNEKRHFDLKATFYSLDEDKIDKEFEKFEQERAAQGKIQKESGWSAKGSKILNQYRGENCSGLAYRLLKAGGINQLSKTCGALEEKQVITPNDLFACIEDAKKKELERYPETQYFKREYRHRIS